LQVIFIKSSFSLPTILVKVIDFFPTVTYCITGSSKKNTNAWLPVVTAKFWLRISQSAFGRWALYFWVSHSVTYGTEEMMNHIQRSWCWHNWLCYFKFCFSPLSYIQPMYVRRECKAMGRNKSCVPEERTIGRLHLSGVQNICQTTRFSEISEPWLHMTVLAFSHTQTTFTNSQLQNNTELCELSLF
jgi:hypothetical protein